MESLRIGSTTLHSAQVRHVREIVGSFQIRGTVSPKLPVIGERHPGAWLLELSGSHADCVRTAGCEECRRLFSALLIIAVYLLPKDIPPTTYQFEFCDEYLRPLPVTNDCPNGRLVLELATDGLFLGTTMGRLRELGLLDTQAAGAPLPAQAGPLAGAERQGLPGRLQP